MFPFPSRASTGHLYLFSTTCYNIISFVLSRSQSVLRTEDLMSTRFDEQGEAII